MKMPLSNAFSRSGLCLVSGDNATVYDDAGNDYVDLAGGLGTCIVGHANLVVAEAVYAQSKKITNASNLHSSLPQQELAEKLCGLSGMDCCFFTNSGTEAVETALKIARKTGKKGIISCTGAFHGRTLGSLSVTSGLSYKQPFEPLLSGITPVPFGDAASLEKAITPQTGAFIVEPIQGEAGVVVPDSGYLEEASKICASNGVLLVLDETQTCLRTGNWFAFQHSRVQPDVIVAAKALGNGFPIGATLYKQGLDFAPGEHGSTFGGNAACCSAALAVLSLIEKENLHFEASKKSAAFKASLEKAGLALRGKGMMIAASCPDAKGVQSKLLKKGVLVNVCHSNTLRFLPPLTIPMQQLESSANALSEVLS